MAKKDTINHLQTTRAAALIVQLANPNFRPQDDENVRKEKIKEMLKNKTPEEIAEIVFKATISMWIRSQENI